MQEILLANGDVISLKEYQKIKNLSSDRVSKHILFEEVSDGGKLFISEVILDTFEIIRELNDNRAIIITSGYRDFETQKRLISQGYKAVKVSPHVAGLALDIVPGNYQITKTLYKKMLAKSTDFPYLRIGYDSYAKSGWNFIHIDVAPYYYNAKTGVWAIKEFLDEDKKVRVPQPWRNLMERW